MCVSVYAAVSRRVYAFFTLPVFCMKKNNVHNFFLSFFVFLHLSAFINIIIQRVRKIFQKISMLNKEKKREKYNELAALFIKFNEMKRKKNLHTQKAINKKHSHCHTCS